MSVLILKWSDDMARISVEEKEKIRSKIIDTARVRFINDGFDKTSTKQIAKEVGIAEGTLFNYFDSKVELFFEAISLEYGENDYYVDELQITEDVVTALSNHVMKIIKPVLRIPKGIMSELMVASIKIAKKKPETFKRLAENDEKYMEDLYQYLENLRQKGVLKDVNTKMLSENIFSIVGFEVLMYMYYKDIQKEDVFLNIEEKIKISLYGYLKGV